MTIAELSTRVGAKILCAPNLNDTVDAYYAGDFLSRVMGKAPSGCAWFTIMTNVNAAGVAVLAEIKAIVLCEGVAPDPPLVQKCTDEGIALLSTDQSVFDCCKLV